MSETAELIMTKVADLAIEAAPALIEIIKDKKNDAEVRVNAGAALDQLLTTAASAMKHHDHASDIEQFMEMMKNQSRGGRN